MRWFRGRKAEEMRKQKIKVREAPKAVPGQKPDYKSPQHRQRAPKIKKPRVKRPFITDFSSMVTAADADESTRTQDCSMDGLRFADAGENGPIIGIAWKGGAGCQFNGKKNGHNCGTMKGRTWKSLAEFIAFRPMSKSPNGKEVGIYGYTHPECGCYLEVKLAGSSEEAAREAQEALDDIVTQRADAVEEAEANGDEVDADVLADFDAQIAAANRNLQLAKSGRGAVEAVVINIGPDGSAE